MNIIRQFFQLALLRRKPQDLPYSKKLLQQVLVAYAFVAVGSLLGSYDLHLAIAYTATDMLVLAGFTWTLLLVVEKSSRMVQTLTALVGVQTVLQLVAWPFLLMVSSDGDAASALPSLALNGLMIWVLVSSGFVYRHALDQNMFVGVLVAVAYLFTSMLTINALFGAG